jgi:formylglycine-generating enzyme required for sulfatase activity/dienelactone hydrolase
MTGYQPAHDLLWNLPWFPAGSYALAGEEAAVPGMSFVSGTAWRVGVGSYLGLHMPGLEHLEPRETGDFLVDRTEVTNREYKRFVDAGGYENRDYWREPFLDGARRLDWEDAMTRLVDRTGRPGPAGWEVGDFPDGQDELPVGGISWFEAAAYAEFAGKRLPTIHHWNRFALTWASGDIVPVSNLEGSGPRPVGETDAMNRFGTVDCGGNVREWCVNKSDRGDRFILGGGWNDPAYGFNDAYAQSAWDRSATNGVRCIRYVRGGDERAVLEETIPLPHRDLLAEPPVPDDTFALYRNQFLYDATPLNAAVVDTLVDEDYVRQKVEFDAAYGGERMAAYLFLPRRAQPPLQAVVYFPGSGSVHARSSEDLAPRSSRFVPKSGRVLVFPVYKSTYERGDGLASVTPNESSNFRDHVIMWVKDLRRTVDYLETRADIDTGKLAYLGASWGAALAPFMLAIEDRFRAAIVVVAGMHMDRALPEVSEGNYLPRVTVPLLMLNGKYDFFFPYETSQLPYFELLGTPVEDKKMVLHETGHAFPRSDYAREALIWLDRYLEPVR